MKENKCCFHCLHCRTKEGKYTCSYFKSVTTELPVPFETCCEYFECFQCAKHNKEYCFCYDDIEIKSEDIKVETEKIDKEGEKIEHGDSKVTVIHIDTGIKVINTNRSQKKAYEKCINDLKILLIENGYGE